MYVVLLVPLASHHSRRACAMNAGSLSDRMNTRQVEAGEILQHLHHILGLAATTYQDRQAEAAVLVNHI